MSVVSDDTGGLFTLHSLSIFFSTCPYLCPIVLGGQGDGGTQTRQVREAVFELKVKQEMQDELNNQLKW